MELNQYQETSISTAVYAGRGMPMGLIYIALKLSGEAGEFSEHLGKAIRDDGFGDDALTDHRKTMLMKELGDVMWYVAAAAGELGYTLEEVALANINKLADRKDRGVLGGSGDER